MATGRNERSTSVTVSYPELDTILAALRLFQQARHHEHPIDAIATNYGDHPALDLLDIDALCERLNGGD